MKTILYLVIAVTLSTHTFAASILFKYEPESTHTTDTLGNPVEIINQSGLGSITFTDGIDNVTISDILSFDFTSYITAKNAIGAPVSLSLDYNLVDLTSISITVNNSSITSLSLQASKNFTFPHQALFTPEKLTFTLRSDYLAEIAHEDKDAFSAVIFNNSGTVTTIPEPSTCSMLGLFITSIILIRRKN